MHSGKLPPGLGGALLADLALRGRVRLGEGATLVDASPTGDPVLDPVLSDWGEGEAEQPSLGRLANGLGVAQTKNVIEQTVADGLAREQEGEKRRVLPGRKPAFKLPTERGEEPRARARAVLLGEAVADERTAVLVALVDACGLVGGLVPREARKAAEQRARALEQAEGVPAAVREVIGTIQRQIGQTVSVTANPPG